MMGSGQDDAIVALATPPGRSAIAIVRGSGTGCLDRLSEVFSRPVALLEAEGHTALVGRLVSGESDDVLDEVSILIFRAPKSYTGEDSFEIGCHGNPRIVQRVIEELLRVGFRLAEPGEFSLRAFLAGKMDLTQAEAVHELVTAQTDRGRELALQRLGGSVRKRIDEIKEKVAEVMVQLNVRLDYGEDEVEDLSLDDERLESALMAIDELLVSYRRGRLFQEGASVVLVGEPNVGKSSLFNALLQEERAITDPTPGTTRDYLEVSLDIRGIPVRLFDTAGLRHTKEGIEQRGIAHTERLLEHADVIVRLRDASELLRTDGGPDLETSPSAELLAYNKADLLSAQDSARLGGRPDGRGPILISATTHEGLGNLEEALAKRLLGEDLTSGAFIDSPRQKALLEEAAEAIRRARRAGEGGATIDLVAEDVQAVLGALGQITGEVTTSDLLEQMFSSFCLGK